MKLKLNKGISKRLAARLTKKVKIRKSIFGTASRPRLCIFKSNAHCYGSLIDDNAGVTLASCSSIELETESSGKSLAKEVGAQLAKKALAKGIKAVVFDRNGFLYHGRVKSFADGAREAGLNF